MEGRRSGRRVEREARDDLARAMQILFCGRRPVDLGVQEPTQALPTTALDRVEDVTNGRYLLCHDAKLSFLTYLITVGPGSAWSCTEMGAFSGLNRAVTSIGGA
jgi:hypothetical protein